MFWQDKGKDIAGERPVYLDAVLPGLKRQSGGRRFFVGLKIPHTEKKMKRKEKEI